MDSVEGGCMERDLAEAVGFWRAACGVSGRREAAERGVAQPLRGFGGYSGTCTPRLRQLALPSAV